jgi:uncharacterized coiled-coil DUF342 family protein
MAGIGEAASIIAVVDLSAKVGSLCFRYSREVAGARESIAQLQKELVGLQDVIKRLNTVLQRPDSASLTTRPEITRALDACRDQLEILDKKLDLGKTRKALSRVGFRALKWPFESKEVEQIISKLERCQQTMSLAFQVDQTYVIAILSPARRSLF